MARTAGAANLRGVRRRRGVAVRECHLINEAVAGAEAHLSNLRREVRPARTRLVTTQQLHISKAERSLQRDQFATLRGTRLGAATEEIPLLPNVKVPSREA